MSLRHSKLVSESNHSQAEESHLTRNSKLTKFVKNFYPLHQGAKEYIAFTLAEVLITLGIIGVVAALTLPTLIHKQQDKEVASKLKKVNSILNQSFQLAVEKYGEVDSWGFRKTENGDIDPNDTEAFENDKKNRADMSYLVLSRLSENLKVLSTCYLKDGCNEKNTRYNLWGETFGTLTPQVVLSDGSIIYSATVLDKDCSKNIGNTKVLKGVCGEIFVDINGNKGPNATGRDIFMFYYAKYGIIPMGTASDTTYQFASYCSLEHPSQIQGINGYGCTAWVIENENRDYLHCNDLSWDGKRKCK